MTRYITVQEAMRLTGKSRRTLYRDMNNGMLKYHKNARGRRVFEEENVLMTYSNAPSCSSEIIQDDQPISREKLEGNELENQSKLVLINSIILVAQAGVPLDIICENTDIPEDEIYNYLSHNGDIKTLLEIRIDAVEEMNADLKHLLAEAIVENKKLKKRVTK